jgi:3-hydroxyisobutyrate dehydrogenase
MIGRRWSSSSSTSVTVGFIGVGNMGEPMARNLAAAGHGLVLYDVNTSHAQGVAQELGGAAAAAASVEEVAASASVVVTMLPATTHVEDVYLGAAGVLAHAAPGTLFIDSSTIAPQGSQKVATAAAEAGMVMVDAPVSGGVKKAVLGSLTFMVVSVTFPRHHAMYAALSRRGFTYVTPVRMIIKWGRTPRA